MNIIHRVYVSRDIPPTRDCDVIRLHVPKESVPFRPAALPEDETLALTSAQF